MPPVKFADIPKTANEVLKDDYVESHKLKAKQKTTFAGAVATTEVDILTDEESLKKGGATPAKISWKIPKPFGIAGVSVDKLDFDKKGGYAVEVANTKDLHGVDGLTATVKTDLMTIKGSSLACTYTGIKDTNIIANIKMDADPSKIPAGISMEVTRALNKLTVGAAFKKDNFMAPDVGARFTYGNYFFAVTALEKFNKISGFGMFKVADNLKLACTATMAKKTSFGAGAVYDVKPGVKVKGKVEKADAITASCGMKYEISKGLTTTVGAKVTFKDKIEHKYGVQVSIE